MPSPYWTINGQIYPNTDAVEIQEGELIRFRYQNLSMMPHPMHLHGHFFKVANPSLPPDRWRQKDPIVVDPGQRIEIEFLTDNPRNWFHHCHNLYHMDAGMTNVVVYKQ